MFRKRYFVEYFLSLQRSAAHTPVSFVLFYEFLVMDFTNKVQKNVCKNFKNSFKKKNYAQARIAFPYNVMTLDKYPLLRTLVVGFL